ncbi:MAG: HTH domain-containing protein [Candidatus Ancillula trichonymphae]|jgi:DNA-binding Lrp family transcriptional regulator|nr:HTH domain-containing protein [Candidatus Ancillula trichonymphae]
MRKNIKDSVFQELSIISYLYENDEAKISELAKAFGVSEDVIIEDLKTLQVAGDSNDAYLNQKLITFNPDWLDERWVELHRSFGMENAISLTNLEVLLLVATPSMFSASVDNENVQALLDELKCARTSTNNIISGQPVVLKNGSVHASLDDAVSRSLVSFVYNGKLREFFHCSFKYTPTSIISTVWTLPALVIGFTTLRRCMTSKFWTRKSNFLSWMTA